MFCRVVFRWAMHQGSFQYNDPVLIGITAKISQRIVAYVGQDARGARERITYALKAEFIGAPEIIRLLVDIAQFNRNRISFFEKRQRVRKR